MGNPFNMNRLTGCRVANDTASMFYCSEQHVDWLQFESKNSGRSGFGAWPTAKIYFKVVATPKLARQFGFNDWMTRS